MLVALVALLTCASPSSSAPSSSAPSSAAPSGITLVDDRAPQEIVGALLDGLPSASWAPMALTALPLSALSPARYEAALACARIDAACIAKAAGTDVVIGSEADGAVALRWGFVDEAPLLAVIATATSLPSTPPSIDATAIREATQRAIAVLVAARADRAHPKAPPPATARLGVAGRVTFLARHLVVRGGALSVDAVRRGINTGIGDVQRCYESALAANQGLAGTVELEWHVNASGRVTDVVPTRATSSLTDKAGGSDAAGCIEKAVRAWRYPSSTGASVVVAAFGLHPV